MIFSTPPTYIENTIFDRGQSPFIDAGFNMQDLHVLVVMGGLSPEELAKKDNNKQPEGQLVHSKGSRQAKVIITVSATQDKSAKL
ncbi:hypothetical protein NPIL_71301 [Nephila pilipes]|uniref:Uncharacterized protein n=1 Tax=Nephila pilipes TaxID=299642 RepID=A0A8X6NPH9_NEPPI|nr:hypothetical protein NPIL_71301 [Nephila pilipes]